MGRVITQTELDFKVEPAKEPEPAVVTPAPEPESQPEPQIDPEPNAQTEPDPESIPEQELSSEPEPDAEPKILDKWKTWLNGFVKTVTDKCSPPSEQHPAWVCSNKDKPPREARLLSGRFEIN